MFCEIYKSSKKDEMYLYVARDNTTEDQGDVRDVLPEPMRIAFGRATFVMKLELNESKKLARVNVLHVMDSIMTNGFFIQMPPEGFINPAAEPEGLRGA